MVFRSKNSLPRGYRFDAGSNISADEAVELWRRAQYVQHYVDDDKVLEEWDEAVQESMVILGVRDHRKYLVGIASIDGDLDHASLNHLAVHPEHRGQGIGQTLVKERVRIADQLGVRHLDVDLADTNNLLPTYVQLGFRAISGHNEHLVRQHIPTDT